MRNRGRIMRVGNEFDDLMRQMKSEYEKNENIEIELTEFTNKIAREIKRKAKEDQKEEEEEGLF